MDDTGRIVREVKLASEPEALLQVLTNPSYRFRRIGLEAGPLSQWLFSALAEAGLPVISVETRHMRAVLKAQINKTDPQRCARHRADDAGGALSSGACEDITQSEAADALTHRKLLQSKAIAIENDLRATLRNFGPVGEPSSRADHHAGGPAQAARGLQRTPSSPPAAWSPMGPITSTSTGRPLATSTASSRARSPPTCRCRRKHRDLDSRQRGDVDRNLERMRRHVVGQHQHRCLARSVAQQYRLQWHAGGRPLVRPSITLLLRA